MKPQPPWRIEQEDQQPKPKRSAWELQARCEPQAHHKQIRCTDHRVPRRRCSATKAGPQGTIDNLCALPPNTAPMWPSLSVTPRPEQTTRVCQAKHENKDQISNRLTRTTPSQQACDPARDSTLQQLTLCTQKKKVTSSELCTGFKPQMSICRCSDSSEPTTYCLTTL